MEKNRLLFIIIPAGMIFALSFLTGLVSGVGLFTALLRALLFGLIFGAGGFGLRVLIGKFLPELLLLSPSEDDSAGDAETGETGAPGDSVDIVVEDNEDDRNLYKGADQDDDRFVEVYGEDGAAEIDDGAVMADEIAGDDREDEAVEELQGEDVGDDAEEPEEVEELDPAEDGASGPLPDLDSFSDSFQSVAASQESGAFGGSAGMEIDVMGTHQDSATVAKAVRTIMKRDQEG